MTIDHTNEAVKAIERVEATFWDEDSESVHMNLKLATAHAVLALVEQQRIANLLAFAGFKFENQDGVILTTTLEGAIHLRTQAGKALGIPDSLEPEPSDAGASDA
jgi:hypothetical protein